MNSAFGASSCLCQLAQGRREDSTSTWPSCRKCARPSPTCFRLVGAVLWGEGLGPPHTYPSPPSWKVLLNLLVGSLPVHVKGADQTGSLILNTHHPLDHDHDLKRRIWEWICQTKRFWCTVPGCLGSSLGSTIVITVKRLHLSVPPFPPLESGGHKGTCPTRLL